MPQLPAGWEETTLQLCTLPVQEKISLTQVSEDNYISTENMLPNIWWVVISSGLPNINSITKFQKWDILFSNIRTYFRKLWYATFTGGVSNDVLVFRGNYSKIYSKFLFYRLSDNSFFDYTIKTSKWTKMPRWDKEAIWNFPIHLPPLPEQQAIAAVLSSFDDKIELLRAENQTLEQMGQELFKERFGKWKVGDELPEGWRVGKLGEKNFAEIIGSWIERFDREKIYLATADVINSSISNSNTKITYQDRPSRANMQPTEKSIWFAKMQDSRKLLMFDDYSQDEIENYILSTWFAGIKTSELSHYYLWCFVLSDDFDMIKNNMANGAVQIAVNNSNLEKIEILIPNEEFLRKFNEFVKPLFKKIYLNNKQITSLSATRDQLLPKLMSWEVRVKI